VQLKSVSLPPIFDVEVNRRWAIPFNQSR